MKRITIKTNTIVSLGLILTMLAIFAGPFAQVANAAALTAKSDTMSSLKVSTNANHTIRFTTPTGVAASETITITMPTGWGMGAPAAVAFGDIDLTDDGVDVAIAALASGATWGAAVSGQVITLTNGTTAVAGGSLIAIEIGTNATFGVAGVNQLTNHATAGTYSIAIAGTFTDTGNIAVTLITDDQVATTATVVESLTFSINDNAIGFGTLTTANARFATGDALGGTIEVEAHTITVGTNGSSGFSLTVTGSTLTSGANTIAAIGAVNTPSAAGTAQYGIRANVSGGIGTVAAPYAAAGFALDTVSFPDQIGSATGATASSVYSMRYIANIAANTPAGSYTSTLTYTATATF